MRILPSVVHYEKRWVITVGWLNCVSFIFVICICVTKAIQSSTFPLIHYMYIKCVCVCVNVFVNWYKSVPGMISTLMKQLGNIHYE